MHSRSRIVIDGAIAGAIGAVVVALWFLVLDAARGQMFFTPALLAATILHGLRTPGLHHNLSQLCAEYSALHLFAFMVFGIAGALLLEAAESEPTLMFALVIF